MATARSKQARRRAGAAPRSRASRSAARNQRSTAHGRELWAIACVALALFLAAILYGGVDGGSLGRWLDGAVRWLFGLAAFALPILFLYVGYLLVVRRERRPPRGLTWGLGLMGVAFLLAAAADSFGLFSGERPAALFTDAYMRSHGGVAGEGLWAVLHGVIGRLGVNLTVAAFAVAGLLLATGSSLRQWAHHSRRGVAAAGRAARTRAEALSARRREAATTRSYATDDEATTWASDECVTQVASRSARAGSSVRQPPWLIDAEIETPEFFPDLPRPSQDLQPEPVGGRHEEEQLALVDSADGSVEGIAATPSTDPVVTDAGSDQRREWVLPDDSFLKRLGHGSGETADTIRAVSQRLVETLGHFGIQSQVIGTVSGPRVTRYELQLAPGIKVSRVAGLKDDIAYALAATDVRVQAPIPGKTAVGVEVPNVRANYVSLGDIHGSFPAHASPMSFWLGKDVTGKAVLADLVKMVHLLIAGTTGSGKSGCLNALISSILLRATPEQVRMIMIDPKKVELSNFDGVPHLLAPVVTNMKQATYVLDNICREMDRRYDVLSRNGCQDIRALNKKLEHAGEETMPYIMVIVDELADLMMQAPSEVEDSIIRLGQLGRSSGVHVVVATQRPSVDVVTGMIKTNIPSRIAFAVSSQTDSRIILDQGGAESLLGMGDMLFSPMGSSRLLRVQGALITTQEMKLLTGHWRRQAKPEFREDLLVNPAGPDAEQQQTPAGSDPLLAEAVRTVVGTGAASVALLQRRLRVGYARAGRLIDIMEEMGIISGYDGSKARSVLIDEDELSATLARLSGDADAADAETLEEALVAGDDKG